MSGTTKEFYHEYKTAADLVIADLAAANVLQAEQIVHLTEDRDSYRELSQQAIHTLHDVVGERDRLRRQVRTLRESRQVTTTRVLPKDRPDLLVNYVDVDDHEQDNVTQHLPAHVTTTCNLPSAPC